MWVNIFFGALLIVSIGFIVFGCLVFFSKPFFEMMRKNFWQNPKKPEIDRAYYKYTLPITTVIEGLIFGAVAIYYFWKIFN